MKTKVYYFLLVGMLSGSYLQAQLPSFRMNSPEKAVADTLPFYKSEDATKIISDYFFPSFKDNKDAFFSLIYNEDQSDRFYFVNNAALQVNKEGAMVTTELSSAYLGPLRVSFGSILSNTQEPENEEPAAEPDADETNSFQRLVAGGGNMYLNFELPVFFKQKKLSMAYLNVTARAAIDVAEFSNDVDTSTGNGNLKSNLYLSWATDQNEFDFFVNTSYGYYFGHPDFYERLSLEQDKGFLFGQLVFGVTIQNRIRFALTTNTFSSEEQLRSGKVILGVNLLSGFFEGGNR